MPTVETRIFLQERCGSRAVVSISRPRSSVRKLSSGSPMPMKTALSGQRPVAAWSSLPAVRIWAMSSSGVRLRTKPERPVRQKVHPTGQPTCVERQSVCALGMDMMTVSTDWPSSRPRRSLRVPSLLTCRFCTGRRVCGDHKPEVQGFTAACVCSAWVSGIANTCPVDSRCQPCPVSALFSGVLNTERCVFACHTIRRDLLIWIALLVNIGNNISHIQRIWIQGMGSCGRKGGASVIRRRVRHRGGCPAGDQAGVMRLSEGICPAEVRKAFFS